MGEIIKDYNLYITEANKKLSSFVNLTVHDFELN